MLTVMLIPPENNLNNDQDHTDSDDDDDDEAHLMWMMEKGTIRVTKLMTTLLMATKVGPCRVLAEGGCLGGLLAPRFQFSYFESLIDLNCSKLNLDAQF